MSKFFDETMQGLLEAAAIEFKEPEKTKKPIEDVITVSYDEGFGGEMPLLMVSRKDQTGVRILKVFKEDEAMELYRKLIGQ